MNEVHREGKVAEPRLLYNINTVNWINEHVVDPAKNLRKKLIGKKKPKKLSAQKAAIQELRKKVLEKTSADELSKKDCKIMTKECSKLFGLIVSGASHIVIEKKKWKLALSLREECDSANLM